MVEQFYAHSVGAISCTILRRHTGEMSHIPFARGYIILNTNEKVTHWVKIANIIQLREKYLGENDEGKPQVAVLFSADSFNFEVTNVDVIQFLTELHLGAGNEESY